MVDTNELIKHFRERYFAAAHAIQTGVMYDQQYGSEDGSPKHLRTGINLTKVEISALVTILIRLGLLTELEWSKELALQAEQEVKRYEKQVSQIIGKNITLK